MLNFKACPGDPLEIGMWRLLPNSNENVVFVLQVSISLVGSLKVERCFPHIGLSQVSSPD